MKWLWFAGSCFLAAATISIAAYLVAVLAWLLVPPKVKVTAVGADDGLHINIIPNFRVNNIIHVLVWNEGEDEYAWVVRGLRPGNVSLRYGQIPNGAEQRIPPNGIVPTKLSGTVRLVVAYQYDYLSASMDEDAFMFVVTDGGEVGPVAKASITHNQPRYVDGP